MNDFRDDIGQELNRPANERLGLVACWAEAGSTYLCLLPTSAFIPAAARRILSILLTHLQAHCLPDLHHAAKMTYNPKDA